MRNGPQLNTSKPPKPKRVTFVLDAYPRIKNKYGSDVYSKILHMRLEGASIQLIAEKTGVSHDTVGSVISGWQELIVMKEGENWTPPWFNPKRRKERVRSDATAAATATAEGPPQLRLVA